jgi:hypothetical protein
MDQLAKSLGSYLGLGIDRLVVNQTGLSGAFSFDLQFATPEPGGTPPDSGVSIFTALQDQAGLRLESTRAPIDVVVIDRADRLRDDAASVDPPAAQSTKPATATPAQASQPPVAPPRTVAGAPLTAAIAGVVIDSLFGDPLAGVAVDVSAEDAPDNPRAVTTDAHGAFAVDGLAAGVYIVVLHHDDYQTFKREGLRISAGETRKVTAALRFNPIRD